MDNSMSGKTIMVTGATNGIGFVAARELALMGAQTVLVSRSAEKCTAAVGKIKNETGNDQVSYIAADLSTKAGVKLAADEFKAHHSHLDVLLNNAGAIFLTRKESADGIEMTLALNHLNYFYLTTLLLDTLRASGRARVVNVSSGAHEGGTINFDDIQFKHGYGAMKAYSQSKLANLLFTYELARKLERTGVTCNALHPGFVNTGFGKNNGVLAKLALGLASPMQKKVEEGARTSIYLASSPEVENISGKYFFESRVAESNPESYDRSIAERLWKVSLDLLGL